jgi:3'(2'), 5'-bisphosphate nucleotidase
MADGGGAGCVAVGISWPELTVGKAIVAAARGSAVDPAGCSRLQAISVNGTSRTKDRLIQSLLAMRLQLYSAAGEIQKEGMGLVVLRNYQAEAFFAVEAVQQAARLCLQIEAELVLDAMTKDDRSPVTVADFASQAVTARRLDSAFPRDPLVAEEGSSALRQAEQAEQLTQVTKFVGRQFPQAGEDEVCDWIDRGAGLPAGRFWTLDPIDGTKGFLRGDHYAVALALIESGQVVLGALACPHLGPELDPGVRGQGATLLAVRGEGAWAGGLDSPPSRRLRVSPVSEVAEARLLRSYESGHTDVAQIEAISSLLGLRQPARRMDSQAKFAVVAGANGELILRLLSPQRLDYREKIWDQAAGSVVVEEAGGRVTDLAGKGLNFGAGRLLANNIGVLVSNRRLHEPLLRAIAAVIGKP